MKLPDWPERLATCIEEARPKPFDWGANDCCTFAAACVQAQTGGGSPLAGLGNWTTARGAAKAIQSVGGLEAALDARFERLPNPLMMQRGDLALVENHGQKVVAVCSGLSMVVPGANGLESLRTFDATAAWRVA